MSKLELAKAASTATSTIKRHSPEILTGIGMAGMAATVILSVKATPKALMLIENEKRERGEDKLPPIDIVKVAWKPYIPAMVTGVLSATCIVGASSANARRNAALATAYTLSDSALREYKNKVIDTIGDEKEKEIRDAIAKDTIEKDPISDKEVVFTGTGDTLCYDILSGRYFRSDKNKIDSAVNIINERLLDQTYVSLNDFYYEIGLSSTKLGNELGWSSDKGLIRVDFSSQLAEDGTPCLVVDYDHMPCYDFDRWL